MKGPPNVWSQGEQADTDIDSAQGVKPSIPQLFLISAGPGDFTQVLSNSEQLLVTTSTFIPEGIRSATADTSYIQVYSIYEYTHHLCMLPTIQTITCSLILFHH